MSSTTVTVRPEVARAFLSDDMHRHGAIDLDQLAKLAKNAIVGSTTSLEAATAIADGGWINRFLQSGDMQRHVIQSITHIRDISKVNLGLSAICNDLAVANLEHARRIDANQQSTGEQLVDIQRLTSQLLQHVQRPRKPPLLESLGPALTALNAKDRKALSASLTALSDGIDEQYSAVQDALDQLQSTQSAAASSCAEIDAATKSLKAELIMHMGLLSARIDEVASSLIQDAASVSQQIEDARATSARGLGDLKSRMFKQMVGLREQHEVELNRRVEALSVRINEGASATASQLEQAHQYVKNAETSFASTLKVVAKAALAQKTSIDDATDFQGRINKSLADKADQREHATRQAIERLRQELIAKLKSAALVFGAINVGGFVYLALHMGLWR